MLSRPVDNGFFVRALRCITILLWYRRSVFILSPCWRGVAVLERQSGQRRSMDVGDWEIDERETGEDNQQS